MSRGRSPQFNRTYALDLSSDFPSASARGTTIATSAGLRKQFQRVAYPHCLTWVWRVTRTLRDALLVAIRGALSIAALLAAAAILDRRLHERCHRRRTSQFDGARRNGHA